MDWLPEWAQIAASVASACVIGLGAYWRIVIRLKRVEDEVDSAKDDVEKLLEKSDARDAELKQHGIQLTEIKTLIGVHIPMLVDGVKEMGRKIDQLAGLDKS